MVGFVSAWRLALLSVAVILGITFAGGLYAYTLIGLTSKSRESYANAGIIAEQAIAQVRTVYSYVGESKALNAYSDAIQKHTTPHSYTLPRSKSPVASSFPCLSQVNRKIGQLSKFHVHLDTHAQKVAHTQFLEP